MQQFQKTEQTYIPQNKVSLIKTIDEFIFNNFKLPNDNLKEISSFIKEDNELEKIIYELTDLIKKEFPKDVLQLKFYDEFEEFELILEIGIFTSFDEETSFEKEKNLENYLYDNYNWNSSDKLLITMEY